MNNSTRTFTYAGEKYATTRVGIIRLIENVAKNLRFSAYHANDLVDIWKRGKENNKLTMLNFDFDLVKIGTVAKYFEYELRGGSQLDDEIMDNICEACSYLQGICKDKHGGVVLTDMYWALSFNLEYVGLVRAITKNGIKWMFVEDTFSFGWGNRHLANDLKSYVRTCKDCGARYFDQLLLEQDGYYEVIDFLSSRDIGYDGYCNDCVQDNYSMRQCDDCNRWHDEDEMYWISNSETNVCDGCLNDGEYHQCERCGEYIYTGDGDGIWTDNERFYCSDTCANDDGYYYDEYSDTYTDEPHDDLVGDYHSTYFEKIGAMRKGCTQWLGGGNEIEVWGADPYSCREIWEDIKYNVLGDGRYGNVEHDGSVTAEIVMQPMTEKAFKEFDFEGLFDKLRKQGYTGHDNEHCGSHVHLSAGYLGYTDNQIKNNAKKVAAFVQKNWNDMVKFSRRKESQLRWCKDYDFEINKDTDFDEMIYDRYRAVNLTNLFSHKRGTIEIRIPRGTLNANTFRATTDFLRHIVRNAKNISWKNINNLNLWFKGITDQNTIDYLKSRNCFEGSF